MSLPVNSVSKFHLPLSLTGILQVLSHCSSVRKLLPSPLQPLYIKVSHLFVSWLKYHLGNDPSHSPTDIPFGQTPKSKIIDPMNVRNRFA